MRISEVAELTGLSISNIRFYEKKGLLEPVRNPQSKYRDYTERDVYRLKQIILYRKMDLSIETVYLILDQKLSVSEVLDQQIQELKQKRKCFRGRLIYVKKYWKTVKGKTLILISISIM